MKRAAQGFAALKQVARPVPAQRAELHHLNRVPGAFPRGIALDLQGPRACALSYGNAPGHTATRQDGGFPAGVGGNLRFTPSPGGADWQSQACKGDCEVPLPGTQPDAAPCHTLQYGTRPSQLRPGLRQSDPPGWGGPRRGGGQPAVYPVARGC
jgi:hypothetical protein